MRGSGVGRTGERHVLPAAYELHPFFVITALSTSRSRLKSATRCFRRRFSVLQLPESEQALCGFRNGTLP